VRLPYIIFTVASDLRFQDAPQKKLLFHLKMEHFDAVFKLDLTEETRTQLQEEEAIASSCFILATPVIVGQFWRHGY